MNPEFIKRVSDLDQIISDWKRGLYSEEEFVIDVYQTARRLLETAQNRFDAGMSKEEWETLGEILIPKNYAKEN